ncbi:MAG: ModD protein [Deltaproteobacteria bacterium]|nr:MAG: ModD protein [Deltaproteobacteria bacterium]
MFELSQNELLAYIAQDLPSLDLSTHLQGKVQSKARIKIITRSDCVMALGAEVSKIAKHFSCEVDFCAQDAQMLSAQEVLLSATGAYAQIHSAWKLMQVLLEYSCAIATYTHQMRSQAQSVNEYCQILGTRKNFPLTKNIAIKALLCGGGAVHRLNLSDSVLFFENHRIIYENNEQFYAQIKHFKRLAPERKIAVEALDLSDAKALLKAGADVVQLDKQSIDEVREVVEHKNTHAQNARIICAGGINEQNAQDYARTGIDAIVTSAMYYAKPMDLTSKITLI